MTKGERTRQRILDVAEQLVLAKGFSGTSLDEIISEADITKGGFFYHFKGRADLARALMRRYLDKDDAFFEALADEADGLSEDPLQRLFIFLKLLGRAMEEQSPVSGCLVAAFTYESHQVDPVVKKLAAEGLIHWREMFIERFEPALEHHEMKVDVPVRVLADMLTTVFEGAIMLAKTTGDPGVVVEQVLQFRTYVRLLFGDLDPPQRAIAT